MGERDENGRFKSGNRAAVGHSNRRKTLSYLRALSDSVTPERWQAIINRALTDAEAGDHRARTWVTDYLIGQPIKMLDLPAADQQRLNEILSLMAEKNVSASVLFESMISQLAAEGEADGEH